MDKSVETDVQSAIQSQVIQTALEANTSKITDAGFQSYLQNAPIPRSYCQSVTNTTLTTGVEAVIAFTDAGRVFDPFQMLASANVFRIPVDGFYSIQTAVNYTTPAGGGTYANYGSLKTLSGSYGVGVYLGLNEFVASLIAAATQVVYIPVVCVKPFRAGDTFNVVGFQASTVNETHLGDATSGISIVWNAPFNQFTAGAGGN